MGATDVLGVLLWLATASVLLGGAHLLDRWARRRDARRQREAHGHVPPKPLPPASHRVP